MYNASVYVWSADNTIIVIDMENKSIVMHKGCSAVAYGYIFVRQAS